MKPADRTIDATVAVVAAGTSDLPVAEEAALSAEAAGIRVDRVTDVGVAGVHRVLDHRRGARSDRLRASSSPGWKARLPSVVAGLTSTPVVAVPTSVGYGASFEGLAALLAMLSSCAPGVAVVNIDSGFGAAQVAYRIVRAAIAGRPEAMRILYFDCIAGISGDMALGALIHAGADPEPIRGGLMGLPVEPFDLDVDEVETRGSARDKVTCAPTVGLIRTYANIRSLLDWPTCRTTRRRSRTGSSAGSPRPRRWSTVATSNR